MEHSLKFDHDLRRVDGESGVRGITNQILRNKGLTRRRPKTDKNSRVKLRNKYDTALKKLKVFNSLFVVVIINTIFKNRAKVSPTETSLAVMKEKSLVSGPESLDLHLFIIRVIELYIAKILRKVVVFLYIFRQAIFIILSCYRSFSR